MTYKLKYRISLAIAYLLLNIILPTKLWSQDVGELIDKKEFDPATMMWYKEPVD